MKETIGNITNRLGKIYLLSGSSRSGSSRSGSSPSGSSPSGSSFSKRRGNSRRSLKNQTKNENAEKFKKTTRQKFNAIKLKMKNDLKREMNKTTNRHLSTISTYLNNLYNDEIINLIIKRKQALNKKQTKSIVDQKYIHFNHYTKSINAHLNNIKQINRDFYRKVNSFKYNIKNKHNSFRKKILTANPRFFNWNGDVHFNMVRNMEKARKLGLTRSLKNYRNGRPLRL